MQKLVTEFVRYRPTTNVTEEALLNRFVTWLEDSNPACAIAPEMLEILEKLCDSKAIDHEVHGTKGLWKEARKLVARGKQ